MPLTLVKNEPEPTIDNNALMADLIMTVMGVDKFAYIKPEAQGAHAVFAADGTQLATFDSREQAMESILHHNLMPAQIH